MPSPAAREFRAGPSRQAALFSAALHRDHDRQGRRPSRATSDPAGVALLVVFPSLLLTLLLVLLLVLRRFLRRGLGLRLRHLLLLALGRSLL